MAEEINPDTIVAIANNYNQAKFSQLLDLLSDYYYNDESLVPDKIYDELIDIYEAKFEAYTKVGAEPKGLKVDLPYYLGSLRKIKQETELENWLSNYTGPYIIEDKIDGLSLLFVVSGRKLSLYTRGAGTRGTDVSHLLKYLKLPTVSQDIAIRGEIVLTKEAFSKVGTGYKNARNLVSGIVNSKKKFNPTIANELSFFAYRIMSQANKADEDIYQLQKMGFLVPNPVQAVKLTKPILENYLKKRLKEAPYEIDGLVIYENKVHKYPIGEDPKHVVAFKSSTETAITKVLKVEWNPSKDRKLKPIVYYQTVFLSGADLNKATGYNARFIVKHQIGPDAKILITRSGDVIPKILSVIEPAPTGPQLPTGEYNWDENGVDIVIEEINDEVVVRKLKHFIDSLSIKNMGPSRIALLVQNGVKNISQLLQLTPDKLMQIQGIGKTIASNFYNDLQNKIVNVPLSKIMDGSGIFANIGEKRFELILEQYPNLLELIDEPVEANVRRIQQIRGFNELARTIAEKLPEFKRWLGDHPMIKIEKGEAKKEIDGSLEGITVVFSGFRDEQLQDRIKGLGGKVSTSVSKNTDYLIMKDVSDVKGKAEKALELGVKLISRDEFAKRFL